MNALRERTHWYWMRLRMASLPWMLPAQHAFRILRRRSKPSCSPNFFTQLHRSKAGRAWEVNRVRRPFGVRCGIVCSRGGCSSELSGLKPTWPGKPPNLGKNTGGGRDGSRWNRVYGQPGAGCIYGSWACTPLGPQEVCMLGGQTVVQLA